MGVAFVETEARAARAEASRRLKMRLEDKPVPKLIRESLAELGRGARDIDVPVDLTWARDYECDVLFAAMRIPWGETRPYRWLAREAHRPLAVRAAASVIARNPLWLIVPCHRVVRADGTIGAYGDGDAGVARKRALLKREGVTL
jgi:O-6-methylguanine DNA methyltransferase